MFVDRHSFLLLSGCEFGNNRAADSGGAFVIQGSDAQVNDSTFDSNYVRYGYGGSICTLQSGTTTVSGSTFSNGSSGIGGSISILSQTDFMISDSVISRCRSAVMGGGVYVRGISFTAHNFVVIDSNSSKGGALACENSKNLTLDGGVISGNRAPSNGGGVYIDNCRTTIDQYNFTGNHANIYGGGIYVTSGQVRMHNTVADDNEAGEMGGFLLVVGDSRFHHFGRYFTERLAYSPLQRMRNQYRSCLSAINIELGQNRAKTGSNIAVVNGSFATLKKLHRPHIPPGVICPLTVRGQSRMEVVSLFHTNHSAQTQNEAAPLNATTVIDANTTDTVDMNDEDPNYARPSKYRNEHARPRYEHFGDWHKARNEVEKNAKKPKDQDIHVCRGGTSILVGNITSGQFPKFFIFSCHVFNLTSFETSVMLQVTRRVTD